MKGKQIFVHEVVEKFNKRKHNYDLLIRLQIVLYTLEKQSATAEIG